MRIETILVPLDGSDFGEQALPVATSIARATGCSVRLAHVEPPLAFAPDGFYVKGLKEGAQRYLSGVVARLAETESFEVVTELLRGATVEDALDEHIEATGADLVVMATHGRGLFSRFWLGSVADALIRRVTRPLLLIHPSKEGPQRPTSAGIRHVLVALDGSEAGERVLDAALSVGEAFGARFTLLRVATVLQPFPLIEDPGSVLPKLEQEERERASAYLQKVAGPLRKRGLQVETATATAAHPAEGVLSYATRNLVDLVAVTTSGVGGVDRARIGSVADKIVRGADAPVLILKPLAGAASAPTGTHEGESCP